MARKKDPNGVGEHGLYPEACLACGGSLTDHQKYFCSIACRRGYPRAEAVRAKLSVASSGWHHTEDARRRISENHAKAWQGKTGPTKGRKHTEETLRKMSEVQSGKVISSEARRKMSEAKRGERSVNWKGGISFEPYSPDFNRALKDMIRERDGWICQGCGRTQRDEGKRLAVHHIDYDKQNNMPRNLVTLCCSCNTKANYDRDEKTAHYRALTTERGL